MNPSGEPIAFPLLVAGLVVLLGAGLAVLWLVSARRQTERLAREARERLASGSPIRSGDYRGPVAVLAPLLEEWRRMLAGKTDAMAEQELLRAKILDGIGEGVLAIDRRKAIALANRKVIELFGLREPVVGTPVFQAIRNAGVHAAFDSALAGTPASRVVTVERDRHIDLHVMPVTGSIEIAAVALFVDVTPLQRLERIRRDFLTDFSHEVRTPLAGLRSALETLEQGRVGLDDQERLRRIVMRQLDRLERLVGDVAELNRIEAGELELQKERVDLASLVRDVAADFRGRAAARSVTIETSAEPAPAVVDPQRVQQIVSNLLDNAIKFSPAGGTVRIAAAYRDGRPVIAVEDSGEGIPPEEQERVFNRFYRIDKSRSQDVPGTGLGLAIVKHLTALHGGSVELESAPGKGSRFRVILPPPAS